MLQAPLLLYLATGYLGFALVMTMAGRFPDFGNLFPSWLVETFNQNDKTNLSPYRFLHFVALAFIVAGFIPSDWQALKLRIFAPVIKCGQQSLAVFCVGTFLSFLGHFAIMLSSGSLLVQIFVSAAGIATMTGVAYYISWSKKQDKLISKKPAAVGGV
jgi:hypothetical protein